MKIDFSPGVGWSDYWQTGWLNLFAGVVAKRASNDDLPRGKTTEEVCIMVLIH